MMGKKITMKTVLKELNKVGASRIQSTVFYQGRTRRWGIAWSFMPVENVEI
jgi:hypothetical protein